MKKKTGQLVCIPVLFDEPSDNYYDVITLSGIPLALTEEAVFLYNAQHKTITRHSLSVSSHSKTIETFQVSDNPECVARLDKGPDFTENDIIAATAHDGYFYLITKIQNGRIIFIRTHLSEPDSAEFWFYNTQYRFNNRDNYKLFVDNNQLQLIAMDKQLWPGYKKPTLSLDVIKKFNLDNLFSELNEFNEDNDSNFSEGNNSNFSEGNNNFSKGNNSNFNEGNNSNFSEGNNSNFNEDNNHSNKYDTLIIVITASGSFIVFAVAGGCTYYAKKKGVCNCCKKPQTRKDAENRDDAELVTTFFKDSSNEEKGDGKQTYIRFYNDDIDTAFESVPLTDNFDENNECDNSVAATVP